MTTVKGVDGVANLIESRKLFDYLWQIVETALLPTHFIAPLFNLVAMNSALIAFHGWTDSKIEEEL